MIYYSGTAKI